MPHIARKYVHKALLLPRLQRARPPAPDQRDDGRRVAVAAHVHQVACDGEPAACAYRVGYRYPSLRRARVGRRIIRAALRAARRTARTGAAQRASTGQSRSGVRRRDCTRWGGTPSGAPRQGDPPGAPQAGVAVHCKLRALSRGRSHQLHARRPAVTMQPQGPRCSPDALLHVEPAASPPRRASPGPALATQSGNSQHARLAGAHQARAISPQAPAGGPARLLQVDDEPHARRRQGRGQAVRVQAVLPRARYGQHARRHPARVQTRESALRRGLRSRVLQRA